MAPVIDDAVTLPRRSFLSGLAALPLAGVPVAAAIMSDPIYAAIEKHKAASSVFHAAVGEWSGKLGRPPAEIEARTDAASEAETEARYDMHEVVPTTVAGLVAYVSYWNGFVGPQTDSGLGQIYEIGWEAIPTIAEAMKALLPIGGAA